MYKPSGQGTEAYGEMYARERCACGITSYERNLQGTGEWSLQEGWDAKE